MTNYKIDYEGLGKGLYAMIENAGLDGVVAFGMMPAEIMKTLEKGLKEKFKGHEKIEELVKDTMHKVTVEVFREADRRKKMVV